MRLTEKNILLEKAIHPVKVETFRCMSPSQVWNRNIQIIVATVVAASVTQNATSASWKVLNCTMYNVLKYYVWDDGCSTKQILNFFGFVNKKSQFSLNNQMCFIKKALFYHAFFFLLGGWRENIHMLYMSSITIKSKLNIFYVIFIGYLYYDSCYVLKSELLSCWASYRSNRAPCSPKIRNVTVTRYSKITLSHTESRFQ